MKRKGQLALDLIVLRPKLVYTHQVDIIARLTLVRCSYGMLVQAAEDSALYEATLVCLLERGVDLPASSRTAALAAALGRSDGHLFTELIRFTAAFDVPILVRALEILDAPRQLKRAKAKLQVTHAASVKRIARLADAAGLRIGTEAEDFSAAAALREIDTALGTGVRKHAKRMRTVETLAKLSDQQRQRAVQKSARLNATKLRKGLRADGGMRTEDEHVTGAARRMTAAERQRMARAVRRAWLAARAATAQRAVVSNLKQTLADAGVGGSDGSARWHVSVSGAAAKRVRKWLQGLPKSAFTSVIEVDQPRDVWRKLVDIVHAAPRDCALPSFLPWVFSDNDAALASIDCSEVQRYREVQRALASKDTAVEALAAGVPIDFSLLHRRLPQAKLPDNALTALVRGGAITVKQLLWFYGDGLHGPIVLEEIAHRLRTGEALDLTFGKVVERALMLHKEMNRMQRNLQHCGDAGAVTAGGYSAQRQGGRWVHEESQAAMAVAALRRETAGIHAAQAVLQELEKIAEGQLKALQLDLPAPVLVLGDASGSMKVRNALDVPLRQAPFSNSHAFQLSTTAAYAVCA